MHALCITFFEHMLFIFHFKPYVYLLVASLAIYSSIVTVCFTTKTLFLVYLNKEACTCQKPPAFESRHFVCVVLLSHCWGLDLTDAACPPGLTEAEDSTAILDPAPRWWAARYCSGACTACSWIGRRSWVSWFCSDWCLSASCSSVRHGWNGARTSMSPSSTVSPTILSADHCRFVPSRSVVRSSIFVDVFFLLPWIHGPTKNVKIKKKVIRWAVANVGEKKAKYSWEWYFLNTHSLNSSLTESHKEAVSVSSLRTGANRSKPMHSSRIFFPRILSHFLLDSAKQSPATKKPFFPP